MYIYVYWLFISCTTSDTYIHTCIKKNIMIYIYICVCIYI